MLSIRFKGSQEFMKFIIRNIGTIGSAEIELNNLTVISGENNSGKTTISKIAYAVGQASSSFPIDYKRHQYNEFRKLYDEIAFNLTRLLRNSEEVKQYDSYQKLMSVLLDIRRSSEVTEFDLSITKELVIEIESYLEGKDEVSPNYFKRIYSILDKLHNLYDEYNYNDPIDKFIFRALKNEFINELLNKRNGAKEAYLSLEMDDFKVFEITFNNKEILSFNSEQNKLPIKDSTKWLCAREIFLPDFNHYNETCNGHRLRKFISDNPLKTNNVLLVDERSVSNAEMFAQTVKYYKLATIIGRTTAGANGNRNDINLLNGFLFSFTGLKVVNPDGSRFHAIGVTPDVFVNESSDDFRNGKDVYIEKALEFFKNKKNSEMIPEL